MRTRETGASVRTEGAHRDPPKSSGSTALGARVEGLDGLRALSMGAVLLYHGQVEMARGGFLGISLFFTLSGFLITSMLLRAHDHLGGIQLGRFWAQRYRRLLPAAYLALVGVVVFGATVATEQQLRDLPEAVVSALAQVANWFFVISDRSYVDLFGAPSPVQHFWSLAIEEQFYLFMPLALLLLLRRTVSTKVLLVTLGSAAAASTAAMVLLFESGATVDRLYYGTDTRASELIVGAMLAVLLRQPGAIAKRMLHASPAFGVVCLVGIIWAWTTIELTDSFLYRGGFLGVALLAAGLITSVVSGRGPVSALLSIGCVAAFGRITYGVYLFHWPIFLWLDEERTGLDGVPLLAVRGGVTLAVATASYHLLEMPIRERRWTGNAPPLRWAVPPVALTLVLGALAVGGRDVETDLAGLDEGPAAAPIVATADEVLDVLAIADVDGVDVASELQRLDTPSRRVDVTEATPFACSSLDPAQPTTCANWLTEWPSAVEAADPDVVLLHLTSWATEEIQRLSGVDDLTSQVEWTVATLHAGIELLTANGAIVVWGQNDPQDMAEALRRTREPFYVAMLAVISERSDVRVARSGSDARSILQDLELYRRRPLDSAPRLMVVGDSTSRALGYGFERWAAAGADVVVWSAGRPGCGLADDGSIREPTGRTRPISAECAGVRQSLAEGVREFRPDIVVVLSHVFDMQARRVDGWDEVREPGQPELDDYLLEEYIATYESLARFGARVVWFTNPCALPILGGGSIDEVVFETDRIRHVNAVVLGGLVDARPDVRLFDLFDVLCPDGEFAPDIGGLEDIRPDGVHLSAEGATWFAEQFGERILALAEG